jgi:hypothetical protein
VNSVDRHLKELTVDGTIQKLRTGLYYSPRKFDEFGEAQPFGGICPKKFTASGLNVPSLERFLVTFTWGQTSMDDGVLISCLSNGCPLI